MSTALSSPQSLDELLSPLSCQDFCQKYWGKQFVHVPGEPGKFAGLFPWSHLNSVLESYRLHPIRMRLVRNGSPVKLRSYMHGFEGRQPTIDAPGLTRQLAEGATLIVDEADELYAPLRELAIALERLFRISAGVNLYAGWRTSRGFNLHWDSHEVLVLQVAGRKHWVVHKPTVPFPLTDEYETAPQPTGPPVWDSVLRQGDLLYLPRGWWHIAQPMDEPSLHLTIGLRSPTGIDLLKWFTGRLEEMPHLRQNLPILGDAGSRSAFESECMRLLQDAWNDGMVERFLTERDENATCRPFLSLPAIAPASGVKPDSRVRLRAPRPLIVQPDASGEAARFRCCSQDWECDSLVLPALQLLNDHGSFLSVGQLLEAVSGPKAKEAVMQFVEKMLGEGLLVAEARCSEESGSMAYGATS